MRELYEGLASTKLVHAPGDRWDYSNLGYALLGHVLECASGKSSSIEFAAGEGVQGRRKRAPRKCDAVVRGDYPDAVTGPDSSPVARFAVALAALDEDLAWDALGAAYCEGDATTFFAPEQREAIQDAGLRFAGDLGELLPPRGRSLYIGVGVAELVPLVFEALVLERDVRAVTLPGPEAVELDRALACAGEAAGCALPRIATGLWEPHDHAPVDHLWMTSVLTDPDAFPALHDLLYERRGRESATGRGSLKKERPRARELIERAVATLAPAGILTTTDEERPLFAEILARHGISLHPTQTARLSGIVGDPVRHCRFGGQGKAGARRRAVQR